MAQIVPIFVQPRIPSFRSSRIALVKLVNLAIHVLLKYDLAERTLSDSQRCLSNPQVLYYSLTSHGLLCLLPFAFLSISLDLNSSCHSLRTAVASELALRSDQSLALLPLCSSRPLVHEGAHIRDCQSWPADVGWTESGLRTFGGGTDRGLLLALRCNHEAVGLVLVIVVAVPAWTGVVP